MDILKTVYAKSVAENEKNLHFWEEYLKNLRSLDFELFSDKLTVPVLVPVGSKILFRGELKHTNEVTVSLGADYFTKCSLKQAEILRQHRIKDAQTKVDVLIKEKDYLQNQISLRKQKVYDAVCNEIVEHYNEEEDKEWREKHKANVKQYKLQSKHKEANEDNVDDEELWNRLEELELQEEIENELENIYNTTTNITDIKESNFKDVEENSNLKFHDSNLEFKKKSTLAKPEIISTSDLLQKVLDRQDALEQKLQKIKQRGKNNAETERDLIAQLDEMEELDELEDEMDRLDDIILNDDKDLESSHQVESNTKIKRSVCFADEDDGGTLEISFKHSEVQPCLKPYNPEKGIQKPSDIYVAYDKLFCEGTTSILKKSKYGSDIALLPEIPKDQDKTEDIITNDIVNKTIVIKDVIEKGDENINVSEVSDKRPASLFKKKRMQKNR